MQTEAKTAGLMIPEVSDFPVIGRHLLGGAAVGGSAAALLSLIHHMRLQKKLSDEERKLRNPTETDENTIVLTLPPKAATSEQMPKHANDPSTFALSWLAAMAGSAGMYNVVRKLYHNQLLKDIKRKEEAARTEVLDQLTAPKVAMDKEGERPTFSYIDAPLGMGLLLTLLGSGAAGYITKKILDEQFRQVDREKYEPPKVNRIVFRTAPPKEGELPPDEKMASDEDTDILRTAIVLHMMKAGDDYTAFEDAGVKAAMEKSGLTKEALMEGLDSPELQFLFSRLLGQTDLRRQLQAAYMSGHPVLKRFKWALKVPGLNNIADAVTYKKLGIRPAKLPKGVSPVAPETLGKMGMFGLPTATGIANSLIGSIMAERTLTPEQGAEGAAPAAAATPTPTPEEKKQEVDPEAVAASIRLSAKDPVARAFIIKKQMAIRKLLQELAAQGV